MTLVVSHRWPTVAPHASVHDPFVRGDGILDLKSFRQVAAELGIDRRALPYLVEVLGIVPKTIVHNGLAKGLDEADVELIREKVGGLLGEGAGSRG
jgi:hypothetical protein